MYLMLANVVLNQFESATKLAAAAGFDFTSILAPGGVILGALIAAQVSFLLSSRTNKQQLARDQAERQQQFARDQTAYQQQEREKLLSSVLSSLPGKTGFARYIRWCS